MQQRLRIAFAGTAVFASSALSAIIQTGFNPVIVLTGPDRRAGRGMKLNINPVKQLALKNKIPIIQPNSLRLDGPYPNEALQAFLRLKEAQCDVIVVAAYGLLLPEYILKLPRFGCLNIHASLLPRWRGAAPIQRAIEAGDAYTGISIMKMDEGLDTGDVIKMETLLIEDDATTTHLYHLLSLLGAKMIVKTLSELTHHGRLTATPQSRVGITYAKKVVRAEAALDWTLDALTLSRKVRAFDPFPGTITKFNNIPLKVLAASPCFIEKDHKPGTVIMVNSKGIVVACGVNTALCITQAQRPGGKRLSAGDFILGFPIAIGQHFDIINLD